MLKRICITLLIVGVVVSIIGFKLLSWKPAIIASITGKNFLLNGPFAALVDVEKLYILPENDVDVALLKVQIENSEAAWPQPAVRERNVALLKHKIDLLTGRVGVQSIDDAKILFQAADASFTPEQKFVYWEGPFGFTADDHYFITPGRLDFTQTTQRTDLEGFSVHRVRKWFTSPNLQAGTVVCVVGRYAGNADLELASGKKIRIPLLEDCYIDRKQK